MNVLSTAHSRYQTLPEMFVRYGNSRKVSRSPWIKVNPLHVGLGNASKLQPFEAHDGRSNTHLEAFLQRKSSSARHSQLLTSILQLSASIMADTPPSNPPGPAAQPSKPVSEALLNDKVQEQSIGYPKDPLLI